MAADIVLAIGTSHSPLLNSLAGVHPVLPLSGRHRLRHGIFGLALGR